MKKKISEELASLHLYDDEYPGRSPYEVVERGPWEDDGKYQNKSIILRDTTDGTFWRYWITRTGSYYSEYYYTYDTEIVHVEKEEVTVTRWKALVD